MLQEYILASGLEEAIHILAEKGERARLVAGATDLILEMERGVRQGIETLVDISRVPGLDQIILDEQRWIHLGPLVTHAHCASSKLLVEQAYPLARAAWEVGAPQIRNRGTVAGNLITASPANDTITPLVALGARVTLHSAQGERVVALDDFYTGVRRTVMRPDEALVDIAFPALHESQRGTFIKLALRRAQAISLVNLAIVITLNDGQAEQAAITLGAVAPTIIHAANAETYLSGRPLTPAVIEHAAQLAMEAARPIDDIRASADYRREMVYVCTRRGLAALANGSEKADFPAQPVLLWGGAASQDTSGAGSVRLQPGDAIQTTINGKPYRFTGGVGKTLLHLLREDALLTGVKEGCAEGECGACTVFLDGKAVMSCLVPAERAHGAQVVTVEGLGSPDSLHPVQQAFIEAGAVQCGYCTPGLLMSAVKLLEERPHPSRPEIQEAITGNLCRCTGYYSIVDAIERASALAAGGNGEAVDGEV